MNPSSITLQWRKSSHCALGDCIELAALSGRIALRDSKTPDRAHLVIRRSVFRALAHGLGSAPPTRS